ncbi:protein of unassigned function [Methylobacterium oryzae CBMB20]|uniref:Protein of unassigned function n=1 Tax=Methylobacterium oryzae CBMB20 TaxID=693986 RepID=A0A089QB11_9HYPH|nr:protein of unassigned function [Methylobacterium oryzae CBMB20]
MRSIAGTNRDLTPIPGGAAGLVRVSQTSPLTGRRSARR